MDVHAHIDDGVYHRMEILPGSRALVHTGLRARIPDGYELQCRPRSGLALKHGITVLNTPGTIDSDYPGEIGIILINTGKSQYIVSHGDKIAQLVLAEVVQAEINGRRPPENSRDGGFGSTGV